MQIEIDQSGKIEKTNKPTVVGFSNSKNRTVIIFATEKQKIERYFRKISKPAVYRYKVFAIMIYLLIRSYKNIEQITIDREYPGKEDLIKSYLLEHLRKSHKNFDKRQIIFKSIGKKSKAHILVYNSYISKKADVKITAREIIQKSGV